MTQAHVTVVAVPATKYDRPTYKSPLKKTHFDVWYRAMKAAAFLTIAAPALMKMSDDFFRENPDYVEGACCGKRKNLQD